MRSRDFLLYDVFTERPFAGNQLAIVLKSDGLDAEAMQEIAREFNLSETVFVGAQQDGMRTPIRIFTPVDEMPFAGHPTVGTAVALSELGMSAANDNNDTDASIIILDEPIGSVRCLVSKDARGSFAEFDLPQLPSAAKFKMSHEDAAAVLGLMPQDIGFENHKVTAWDAGVPYVCIPVHDLDAAASANLDPRLWAELIGGNGDAASPAAYVYCRDTIGHDHAFHARMFSGHWGIVEDPATGSAAAAFAGAVMMFDEPTDGTTAFWIEQGLEMGRPSSIRLELDVEGGKLTGARIGGYAVKIGEGVIYR